MQELGSAWVFKRAIQDNVEFKNANDIVKDVKTYKELVNIWKKVGGVDWDNSIDGEWVESFYKQQKALLKEIGKPKFTEFARSSHYTLPGSRSGETFMEWMLSDEGKEIINGYKINNHQIFFFNGDTYIKINNE